MLKNFKIGPRLSLGFGIILVLMMIIGGYAFQVIGSLRADIDLLVENRMVKVEQTNAIIDHVNVIARGLRNILIDDNKEHQGDELRRIVDSRKIAGETLDQLAKDSSNEKGVALTQKVTNLRTAYVRQTETYLDLVKAGQVDQAKRMLLTEVREVQRTYLEGLENLIGFQMGLAKETGKEAANTAGTASRLIVTLLVVALALSILLAFFLIRSITGPVGQAAALAETMAQGNFTTKLAIDQRDEIGLMATALNTMVAQLSAMIKEIISGVNTLTAGSHDMAAVSKQLSAVARDTSERSATVASATEEMSTNIQSVSAAMEQSSANVNMVASSTEEMTATVNEIAQSAEKARAISEDAVKQSRLTSEKMAVLGESARKIGRVT